MEDPLDKEDPFTYNMNEVINMQCIVKHFNELTTTELYAILKARVNVFVVEQNCPYPELDDKDLDAWHVYFIDQENIVAYLRVLAPGVSFKEASLGRVLTTVRGKGWGKKIVEAGIEVAKEKYQTECLRIEAQCYAQGFYEKFGFKQVSEPFLEDDIWHMEMLRQ